VHHYPSKEDLVIAAVEHLVERRIREFQATFADLPAAQRTPAAAMRVLYDHCFRATFEPWLELAVAARTDPALHARSSSSSLGSFDTALATFRGLFPTPPPTRPCTYCAAADLAVLEGLATGRMIDVPEDELAAVIDAFNAIAAPYFPQSPGGAS